MLDKKTYFSNDCFEKTSNPNNQLGPKTNARATSRGVLVLKMTSVCRGKSDT